MDVTDVFETFLAQIRQLWELSQDLDWLTCCADARVASLNNLFGQTLM